jgi:hypothetical protein
LEEEVCTGTFGISSIYFTNLDGDALAYFSVEPIRDHNASMSIQEEAEGERDLPLQNELSLKNRVWDLKLQSSQPKNKCDLIT